MQRSLNQLSAHYRQCTPLVYRQYQTKSVRVFGYNPHNHEKNDATAGNLESVENSNFVR